MKTRINLSGNLKGRLKPQYTKKAEGFKSFPFGPSHSFRQDISNQISIALKEGDHAIFPITGKSAFIIDIYSNREFFIAGVLKNVLDACRPKLITDDSQVESIIIKHQPTSGEEHLHLYLYSNRLIYSLDSDTTQLRANPLFEVKISTVVDDRYHALPRIMGDSLDTDINSESDDALSKVIQSAWTHKTLLSTFDISMVLNVQPGGGDIDNQALMIIKNATGVIYDNPKMIRKLHLLRRTIKGSDDYVDIEIPTRL